MSKEFIHQSPISPNAGFYFSALLMSNNCYVQIFRYRHALLLLTAREISNRYKGTVIGAFWLVLQPLMMVMVYTFVFSVIMKVRLGGVDNPYHFALYLVAALLPYMAFQDAVIMASQSLFSKSDLLKKSTLPAILFPLAPVLSTLVTEFVALMIIIAAAWLLLEKVSYTLILLPLLVLIRLTISIGAAWFISVLTVFIKDLSQSLGLLLTLLMFLTPIVYPPELIPENFVAINNLNPFYHLLEAYRAVLIRGEWPDSAVYVVAGTSLIVMLTGAWFFQKTIERAKDFV